MISKSLVPGYLLICLLGGVLWDEVAGQYLYSKYACVNAPYCYNNYYSLACPVGEKIALKGAYYGTKPFSTICPNSAESCQNKARCCQYQDGDCLQTFGPEKLFDVYNSCSLRQRCGWLYASSVDNGNDCTARKTSNYAQADHHCVHDASVVDICSADSRSMKTLHLHHSAFGNYSSAATQCTCVITPTQCDNSTTLKFRALDVRLHDDHNITKCDDLSRLELVGLKERKMYACEKDNFMHGYEKFFDTRENRMVLYLHTKWHKYPTKVLLAVQASNPNLSVSVTCGPDSMARANKCPPLILPGHVDDVKEVPPIKQVTPTIIKLDHDDVNLEPEDEDTAGEDKGDNPAMAAIIGGVAAGVVVLILLLVVVVIILRRYRQGNGYHHPVMPKLEDLEEHQINHYETVEEAELASHMAQNTDGDASKRIYHQPWGKEGGVPVHGRAKPGDLAYATSEEIKVLIEKMEQDRQFLNEGGVMNAPDPTYYRLISDYQYKPSETETQEGDSDVQDVAADDSDTESRSDASDNCGTEKLESEDSKVEADRGVEDSDVESHKVESETVSAYYDGYESPRVSSLYPSDASSSVRDSIKSDMLQSDVGPANFASKSENIIREDSDSDVPLEPAPPVKLTIVKPTPRVSKSSQSDATSSSTGEIILGAYRTPKGSTDEEDGTPLKTQVGSEPGKEGAHYSDVYDSVKDKAGEKHTKL